MEDGNLATAKLDEAKPSEKQDLKQVNILELLVKLLQDRQEKGKTKLVEAMA